MTHTYIVHTTKYCFVDNLFFASIRTVATLNFWIIRKKDKKKNAKHIFLWQRTKYVIENMEKERIIVIWEHMCTADEESAKTRTRNGFPHIQRNVLPTKLFARWKINKQISPDRWCWNCMESINSHGAWRSATRSRPNDLFWSDSTDISD